MQKEKRQKRQENIGGENEKKIYKQIVKTGGIKKNIEERRKQQLPHFHFPSHMMFF